jgi:hypothetical protein
LVVGEAEAVEEEPSLVELVSTDSLQRWEKAQQVKSKEVLECAAVSTAILMVASLRL